MSELEMLKRCPRYYDRLYTTIIKGMVEFVEGDWTKLKPVLLKEFKKYNID